MRLHVAAILPDAGAGGFALQAGATTPRNVFIARDWLAPLLDHPSQVNALLVVGKSHQSCSIPALQQALAATATLGDYGLTLDRATDSVPLYLHSSSVVMRQAMADAAQQAATRCGGRSSLASVYLATTIARAAAPEHKIAYAILGGVDTTVPLSLSSGNPLTTDDDLLLNQWAADDLGARVGERLIVSDLAPSWDGTYRTLQRQFVLRGIVPLTGLSADAAMAPNFEGISGVERIEDWNPPFPIDMTRVTARDEAYWTRYRTTPKAFITPAAARGMWQSSDAGAQADWITTVTLQPPAGTDSTAWESTFSTAFLQTLDPRDAGYSFQPVRRQALASAESPTDFGQLFLAMSFFLVLAAAGMAGLLMRLMIERRAGTIGMMQACGWPQPLILRTMLGEGIILSTGGVIIGTPLGLLYARELMVLLSTRWDALIGPATLWLHVTGASVLIGGVAGWLAGVLATGWGTWRLVRGGQVLPLLSGRAGADLLRSASRNRRTWWGIIALLLAAAGCIVLASVWRVVPPALAFFLAGFCLLAAGLWLCHLLLSSAAKERASAPSWGWFALRNAAANRKRSLLTIGLLAGASFILVTVAANSRDVSHINTADAHSGAGGFSLRTVASVPISYDFGSPAGREQLGFAPEDDAAFAHTHVLSFLMSPGGDISCLNITRPPAPRILGVPPAMIVRGGFSVETAGKAANPWRLLDTPLPDGCIPAFGDADSVRWTLHSDLGEIYTTSDAEGRPIRLRFVGLLSGSIFAGELLVSQANFQTLFPAVTAPRLFLLDTPAGQMGRMADVLRANMSDLGLQVSTTRELLARYLSVQQTYLSTFLTLGGLGLLLGVLGMVAAVLQSAFDRRKEFALLTAVGFSRGDLARVLLLEHVGLLLSGIVCGAAAALVACLPQLVAPDAHMNWHTVLVLLVGMILVGVLSCAIAGWLAIGQRLLDGLRSE